MPNRVPQQKSKLDRLHRKIKGCQDLKKIRALLAEYGRATEELCGARAEVGSLRGPGGRRFPGPTWKPGRNAIPGSEWKPGR